MNRLERNMTAAEVRLAEELPADGRDALASLSVLEQVFREAVSPATAIYDSDTGPHVDFRDFVYTEALGLFIATTRSQEINTRIALDAAATTTEAPPCIAETAATLPDKWLLSGPVEDATGLNVLFVPGENFDFLISRENATRAFGTDSRWRLKPHPVSQVDYADRLAAEIGAKGRCYEPRSSGMALLRDAATVGYTTTSELGLIAMALGKITVDFTRYDYEAYGHYFPLYCAVRESDEPPAMVLDRIIACPWSGYLPLDTPPAEAQDRFRQFRAKAEDLREIYRPRAPLPPRPDRPQ